MNKRVVALLLAAVIVVAAVVGVSVVSKENDYRTVTAQLYTANQRLEVQGVLLCEQKTVDIPQSGAVQYLCEDGERVAKNGEIARAEAMKLMEKVRKAVGL